jgi:LmbE family N-acetylglucosaminyl deacetylase
MPSRCKRIARTRKTWHVLVENINRLLVFVAHPDDETIACAGLLQRVPLSLVVFAVDGAPSGYGFERKFGTLRNYSEERFKEAERALSYLPSGSFERLKSPRGEYFPDRQLFENLQAANSLLSIVQLFSPDTIVSHAFEGGHIDHDACSFLANHVAQAHSLIHLEFPLYWKAADGRDVFQKFRATCREEICLNLSEGELVIKNKMLSEYKSQSDIVATFPPPDTTLRLRTPFVESLLSRKLAHPPRRQAGPQTIPGVSHLNSPENLASSSDVKCLPPGVGAFSLEGWGFGPA